MVRTAQTKNEEALAINESFYDTFANFLQPTPPPDITTFATHPYFCGKELYPRQLTLLKLIYADVEHFNDYDYEVINQWTKSFYYGEERIGIPPDIDKRLEWLKNNNRPYFREIVFIGGRRGGKGHLGGIMSAYQAYRLICYKSPQRRFGIDPAKDMYAFVTATNLQQAVGQQFKDIVETVTSAPCFEKYISTNKNRYISFRTDADRLRVAEYKRRKLIVEREIASIIIMAQSSNSRAGRGAAAYELVFDEMAHMLTGTEGPQTAEEVYTALTPALDQCRPDDMIYIPTSPYTKVGAAFDIYNDGLALDEKQNPKNPDILIIQLPSWAQPLDAKICTPAGWANMGDIVVGDRVIGSDGSPRQVIKVRRFEERDVYRVVMRSGNGEEKCVEASGDHLWAWQNHNERSGVTKPQGRLNTTLDLKQYVESSDQRKQCNRVYLPALRAPVQFDDAPNLPIPAYALGALLGDGNQTQVARLCVPEDELVDLVVKDLAAKWQIVPVRHARENVNLTAPFEPAFCVESGCDGTKRARGLCSRHYARVRRHRRLADYQKTPHTNPLVAELKNIGMWGLKHLDKYIPQAYKYAPVETRMELLRGLLDTDGEVTLKGAVMFHTTSSRLRDDVADVVESLGGTVTRFTDVRRENPGYRVSINLPRRLGSPVKLSRKKLRWETFCNRPGLKPPSYRVVRVELVKTAPVQCLTIDSSDGLYLTEHGILTHNSPYEDWNDSKVFSIYNGGKPYSRNPPQLYDEAMVRLEERDPDHFKVERRAQWAEVINAYLSPRQVDKMYEPIQYPDGDVRVLHNYTEGHMRFAYRGHADPSDSQANFGFAIGHTEPVPEWDEDEQDWVTYTHVIFDWLKVWKPQDFPEHQVDYMEIQDEIADIIMDFPSLTAFSFDQYGGFVTVPFLKSELRKRRHRARVHESTFTAKTNQIRAERFKSALGMGWVHTPQDEFGNDEESLLSQELKFLQVKNGRVDRQHVGPVITKDLSDCVMEVTSELLKDQIDRAERNRRLAGTKLALGAPGGYHSGMEAPPTPGSNRDNLHKWGQRRGSRQGGYSSLR